MEKETKSMVQTQKQEQELKPESVEHFASIFGGRTDCWGTLEGGCVKGELTTENYQKHLAGVASLGVYPLRPDGTVWWGAIDIDEDNLDFAKELVDRLSHYKVRVYIERSKGKGYHVFWFFAEPVEAWKVRAVLDLAVKEVELNGLKKPPEIFPKHDELTELNPTGSYLNLPYFHSDNNGGRRVVLNPDDLTKTLSLQEFLLRVERNKPEVLDRIVEMNDLAAEREMRAKEFVKQHRELLKDKDYPALPCVKRIVEEGAPEGCRKDVMFTLAKHYHANGRVTKEEALRMVHRVNREKNRPPLSEKEIDVAVKSAFEKGYTSLGCEKPFMEPYCDPDNCPVAQVQGRAKEGANPPGQQEGEGNHASEEGEENELLSGLREIYEVLGHEQKGQDVVLYAWSKTKREERQFFIASPPKVEAVLSLDVGSVPDWIVAQGVEHRPETQRRLLKQAFQELGAASPNISTFELLGQGLHPRNGTCILISGRRWFVKHGDQGWKSVETPIIEGKYRPIFEDGDKDWLPFNLHDLNRPLKYDPLEVYYFLRDALKEGWVFRQESDYIIHALHPFVYTYARTFPRKPTISIESKTSTGKSSLVQGFYAGSDFPGMGGPFVLNSEAYSDASWAGIQSKYDKAGMTLVLDEQEKSEQRHFLEVLAGIRQSAMGGARRIRGNKNQGYKSTETQIPCILASIEGIREKDQDANRWIITEPVRVEDWGEPEEKIRSFWKAKGVDTREVQRTVLLSLLDRLEEIDKHYQTWKRNGCPKEDGKQLMDTRYAGVFYPALAVAATIGLPVEEIALKIFREKAVYYRENRDQQREKKLISDIMHSAFDYRGAGGYITRTSIWNLWHDPTRTPEQNPVTEPDYGVVIRKEDAGWKLYVRWGNALKSMLRGTEFERLTTNRLAKIAGDAPGFEENSVQVGVDRKRYTKFDLGKVWKEI